LVLTRRQLLKSAAVGAAGAALPLTIFRPGSAPAALAGFSTPLPPLPKAQPVGGNAYRLTARAGQHQFHLFAALLVAQVPGHPPRRACRLTCPRNASVARSRLPSGRGRLKT